MILIAAYAINLLYDAVLYQPDILDLAIACLLYIVSPIDYAPEGILGWIGFTDDGLIVTIGIIIQIIMLVRMVGRKKAL